MYSIQHYVIKLISDPFSVASLVYAELGLSTRLLSSGTRDTDFSRSHFLFILEFGMSDHFFSYLGQGILTFLDRISCLFWSSVCPTVISHIWAKED